jgi:hypothetical protein
MNNSFSKNSPDLKFKYAAGLGDIVACFLHCRLVGWLTHFITGKDKPCSTCSERRHALNVIMPIPFWKIFFKNKKDLLEQLSAEYRGMGYDVEVNLETNKISVSKAEFTEFKND